MSTRENITFPPGRMVGGNLYEPQTTDAEGKPLVVKNGPNIGQSRVDYYFALAIKKGAERHWSETPWGAKIWALGHACFPAMSTNTTLAEGFAWKITDGDGQRPNKKNVRPCDREGYAGHWVLSFGGGYAPQTYALLPGAQKPTPFDQKDGIQPGDFIEVSGSVSYNKSTQNPGVFVNHDMVCLRGYHPDGRIAIGRSVEEAGFGQAVAGNVSAVPTGATLAPPPAAHSPAPPVAAAAAPAHTPAPPAATPPPPVAPNPAFLNPPTKVMLPKANGATYQSFIDAGWTEEAMIREGYLTPY